MKRLERKNKWEILVLSVHSRFRQLDRLVSELLIQTESYPDVDVVILTDGISHEVGRKRTALLNLSQAEYVSFIDDDDLVAEDYVSSIYPLLDGKNDYVGFKVAYYQNGKLEPKPMVHDAKFEDWGEDEDGWYRHITHLNPIKREIAVQFPFEGMAREDYHWSMAIKASGLVKEYAFVDKPLYHYLHSDEGTLTAKYR